MDGIEILSLGERGWMSVDALVRGFALDGVRYEVDLDSMVFIAWVSEGNEYRFCLNLLTELLQPPHSHS